MIKTIHQSLILLMLFALVRPSEAINPPAGFDDLLQVEKGKPFHPLYPFFVGGTDLIGVIVIARNPKKPQAFFETIDSPGYLNPDSIGKLTIVSHPITGGTYYQTRDLGAALALAQLDAIAKYAKSTPVASNL